MKYADDLESGRRSRRSTMTVIEQVNLYRQKLTQKVGILNVLKKIFMGVNMLF